MWIYTDPDTLYEDVTISDQYDSMLFVNDVTPFSYWTHLDQLASRIRVIAPEQRASGRTGHSGGQLSLSLLADVAP